MSEKVNTNLKISSTARLTECAILLALATVLSFAKIIDLPYGGSVTVCSMLPIVIAAYRHGTPWGILTAFVYSIIQLLLGLSNVSYGTTVLAVVSIILFDYIIAFTVIGLGGIFKKAVKNQTTAILLGVLLISLLRYVCHTYVGCTVWAGLSIPSTDAFIFSLAYNGTYMLPETIINIIGAVLISDAVCFTTKSITMNVRTKTRNPSLNIIANIVLAAAAIVDVAVIGGYLQNPKTGDFDITGLTRLTVANYATLAIATILGVVIFAVLKVISKKSK